MTCGHLFNGIGGFALAASWMNWENVMHCEIDPFCNRVMKHHFPNSFQHEDIRTTDFRIWRGRIDLITGGFPCQPFSTGGDRRGSEDPRHLWPEMLRAIREISPRWIVGENVRGLVNWNKGMVFDQVQADLEATGYEVIPFLLPAAGVGAPHRRDRIWFVAYSIGKRTAAGASGCNEPRELFQESQREENKQFNKPFGESGLAAYAGSQGFPVTACGEQLEVSSQARTQPGGKSSGVHTTNSEWQNFPTQSPICAGNDGFPGGLADITFSKWRNESLKALGNAIVPQVAYEIFKAIQQYEMSAV